MPNPPAKHKRSRSRGSRSSSSSSSISVNTSLSSSSASRASPSTSSRSSRRRPRNRNRSPRSSRSSPLRSPPPPRGNDRDNARHAARTPPRGGSDHRGRPRPEADAGVAPPTRPLATASTVAVAGGLVAVPLLSANVRKLGTTKADSEGKDDGRKLTEKEEMDLYLKSARERIGAWNPASPPSVVAAEVHRVLTERFSKGVSQKGISLLSKLLDDMCLSASHMTEVVDVLSQRLATSHVAWENEVRSRATAASRPRAKDGKAASRSSQSQLLADWYIVDGLLKHFRSRALREEKERRKSTTGSAAGNGNGESPTPDEGAHNRQSHRAPTGQDAPAAVPMSLAATLIQTLSDAVPMLIDRYLPRRAEFPTATSATVTQSNADALKELERFRDMVRTWKHVVPRVTVQMAATQLGLT